MVVNLVPTVSTQGCKTLPKINCHDNHSGPTEKVQASHRSLNMADAVTGKRFLWPIVWFCDVIFTHGFDILQFRDVYDGEVSFICSICHTILTIILEIMRVKSTVLTLPKCHQRAVLITARESASRKSTVLTTSGTVLVWRCLFSCDYNNSIWSSTICRSDCRPIFTEISVAAELLDLVTEVETDDTDQVIYYIDEAYISLFKCLPCVFKLICYPILTNITAVVPKSCSPSYSFCHLINSQ